MISIDLNNLPKHIAFIVDGNGRWAKLRNKERTVGHKAGIKAVKGIIQAAKNIGVKVCSFFVFSTENWNRSEQEVTALMNMLREFLNVDINKFEKENIKLTTMGDLSRLDKDIQDAIETAKEKTKNNNGIIVNFCINYGGRNDIINAVNKIIKEGKKSITEQEFCSYLYSSNLPDPDLIIRTSGEQRISNFMLWQGAYAELYFTKTYWPDFDKDCLIQAIYDYQTRDRRFGKVK